MCRESLVIEKTAEDADAIVGDEAHIAARSPGGPRWGEIEYGVELDSYANLILLCRVHHKAVDDQPRHYTVRRLRQTKVDHEAWVADRLKDVKVPGLYDTITGPLKMVPLTTGTAVWQLIDGCHAYLLTPPSDGEVEASAVDLADEFLEVCKDYGDVDDDIKDSGMRSVREAKRTLQDYVSRLAGYELLVFGTRQLRSVPGYEPPLHFQVAIMTVIRPDHPGIELVDQGE